LDDLEEYTNSSERSRIRSATVESAERDNGRVQVNKAASLLAKRLNMIGSCL